MMRNIRVSLDLWCCLLRLRDTKPLISPPWDPTLASASINPRLPLSFLTLYSSHVLLVHTASRIEKFLAMIVALEVPFEIFPSAVGFECTAWVRASVGSEVLNIGVSDK
jgi:hypothetical protein